ncbi:MAG TPA: triose-phosphate isomerase [Candidatus Thermoplasmatota archaeon]|nr:triose-phosphate isomerase [Candidatus Thermoplasmatota archaeon]
MQVPRIVVNAKAFAEAGGAAGLALLRALERVSAAEPVALAPPMTDLALLGSKVRRVSLWAQHTDPLPPGAGTGFVTAAAVRNAGAVGSILNHAEHKIPLAQAKATVRSLHGAGLGTLLCADSIAECRTLARLHPTAIAIEPPELIGGDVSVTTADPRIVSDAVKAVRRLAPRTLVLCGAGVKSGRDVAMARTLGAHGVLVASGVVKAPSPAAAARDLVKGLQ